MPAEVTTPRKILVPIDIYGVSPTSLETLVSIAGKMQRGLLALMLEDVRLQQVADLPFTTEILLHGCEERNLQRQQLCRRHNQASTDAGSLLKKLASRGQVELVLENVVGDRMHAALGRESNIDIFFPARQHWRPAPVLQRARHKAIPRLGCVLADTAQDQAVVETAQLLQRAGLVGDSYVLSTTAPGRAVLESLRQSGSRVYVQANLHPTIIGEMLRHSPYDLLLLPRACLLGTTAQALAAALENASGQILVIN